MGGSLPATDQNAQSESQALALEYSEVYSSTLPTTKMSGLDARTSPDIFVVGRTEHSEEAEKGLNRLLTLY